MHQVHWLIVLIHLIRAPRLREYVPQSFTG
jgi:hypothetical protein